MTDASPDLAVVLACSDRYATIAATMSHLRRQTVRERVELVLVTPSGAALDLPTDAVAGFWGHQIVEIETLDSIAKANAAGIRSAHAPIVALAEDHCFPEPEWAAALLSAHAGPWAVVGPVILNANPESAVSWADYLLGYGPWADPTPSGEAPFLPGHNSSYKRAVLLEYGERLERMLESETVLHMDLCARGKRLYLCAGARAAHVNFSRLDSWLRVQLHSGRVFAAARAAEWSLARRALYAVASPLIPLLRCWRAVQVLRAPGRPRRELARVLPVLGLGLALDGVGQMLGYVAGAAGSSKALAHYEFRRIDHVCPSDRTVFTAAIREPRGSSVGVAT